MLAIVNRWLFKIARSNFSAAFIGFAFRFLTAFMPLSKLNESSLAIAFYHPKPYWEKHALVVPKRAVRSLMSLDLSSEPGRLLLQNILILANKTAVDMKLEAFSILVNGGANQDVPQLHFHVASGFDQDGNRLGEEEPSAEQLLQASVHRKEAGWQIYELQKEAPFHQTVFVCEHKSADPNDLDPLVHLFSIIQKSIRSIEFHGFTVVINRDREAVQDHLMVSLLGKLKTTDSSTNNS